MDPKIIYHTLAAVGAEFYAGLPYLQPKGKGKGPIVVQKAGHMIHLDAPETVARELLELVALSSHVVRQDEKNRAANRESKI
jgi:pimeloyl-ACP methyl ester carboxylesterase